MSTLRVAGVVRIMAFFGIIGRAPCNIAPIVDTFPWAPYRGGLTQCHGTF